MSKLNDLKDEVAILNNTTDLLNTKLTEMEEVLKLIGPGLVCWIQDTDDKEKYFGYYRFNDGWHLAIRLKDEQPQPALRAARFYRLATYKRFDKIVEALIETCKAFNEKLVNTLKDTENDRNPNQ